MFGGLNVLHGTVTRRCVPRHRHQECLWSLRRVDWDTPVNLDAHSIIDNNSICWHPAVRRPLAKQSNLHMHFIPASSAGLSLVERWFRDIRTRCIRRGSLPSVAVLFQATEESLEPDYRHAKPIVWAASVDQIFAKLSRCKATSGTPHEHDRIRSPKPHHAARGMALRRARAFRGAKRWKS